MPLKNPNEKVECPDCNATSPDLKGQKVWTLSILSNRINKSKIY